MKQYKLSDILGFTELYQTLKSQKVSAKTAYKLSRLSRAIATETDFYYSEIQKIISEYAVLDENGNPAQTEDGQGIKIQQGKEVECTEKIQELQNLEVEIPDITFTLEELGNIEFTIDQMNEFSKFIIE